jgi:hypothetical protein
LWGKSRNASGERCLLTYALTCTPTPTPQPRHWRYKRLCLKGALLNGVNAVPNLNAVGFFLFCCLFGKRRRILYCVFNGVVSFRIIIHCTNFRISNIKLIRWAGLVARMGKDRGVHRVLVGSLRKRGHWGDKDVNGRIILR